jgi:hypothetical protein
MGVGQSSQVEYVKNEDPAVLLFHQLHDISQIMDYVKNEGNAEI